MKQFHIKTFNEDYGIINMEDDNDFSDFCCKVMKTINLEENKTVKFLCQGKTLTSANYNTIENGSTILCIIVKMTPSTTDKTDKSETKNGTNIDTNININTKTIIQSKAEIDEKEMKKYSYNDVKASMVTFLNFIRTNTQTKQMYDNEYNQLVYEILKNPVMDNVIRQILDNIQYITEGMKTGKNISLQIAGTNNNQNNQNNQDDQVIDEIVKIGFNKEEVTKIYNEVKNELTNNPNNLNHNINIKDIVIERLLK